MAETFERRLLRLDGFEAEVLLDLGIVDRLLALLVTWLADGELRGLWAFGIVDGQWNRPSGSVTELPRRSSSGTLRSTSASGRGVWASQDTTRPETP